MRVRAEVIKNRLSSSGSAAEFDIVEGRGVDRSTELFDLGKEAGFLIESGFGWIYENTLLGRSRDRAAATLESSAALSARLRAAILA